METIFGTTGERIHEFLRRLPPFGFAGAVLVSNQGEILLNHGYGLADRSNNLPNRSDTVFNLGSVTKQFTAAAILRLEMQGRLSLSDSIARFFNEVPPEKQGVTIHHLLTHTAGIPLFSGEDYEAAGRDETVVKTLNTPLAFEPGTAYGYSNTGYSLLAAVIEIVSGQAYEAFLAEQLFQPAGMEWTGYRLPGWEPASLARGYVAGQDRGIPIEKIFPSWNVMGNGEMLSTTTDLYRWHLALKTDQVLSGTAKQKLWTPFLQEYACGWRVHESEDGRIVEHNGAGDTGMSALLKWYTGPDVLIVLFGNQTLPNGSLPIQVFDEKISSLAFDRPVDLPPLLPEVQDPVDLEEYSGSYSLTGGAEFSVIRDPDGLVLHADNQAAIDLIWKVPPAQSHVLQAFNRRVEAAFGSLVDGEEAGLLAELGDPNRAARFRVYLEQVLLDEAGSQGVRPERKWKVIGTLPGRDGTRPATLMVVQAGAASGTLEVLWEKDQIHGLRVRMAKHPLGIPLRMQARDSFAGYEVEANQTLEAGFTRPASGKGFEFKVSITE
jgi:CubicO group peptidase (beta-lactamase class C family)